MENTASVNIRIHKHIMLWCICTKNKTLWGCTINCWNGNISVWHWLWLAANQSIVDIFKHKTITLRPKKLALSVNFVIYFLNVRKRPTPTTKLSPYTTNQSRKLYDYFPVVNNNTNTHCTRTPEERSLYFPNFINFLVLYLIMATSGDVEQAQIQESRTDNGNGWWASM